MLNFTQKGKKKLQKNMWENLLQKFEKNLPKQYGNIYYKNSVKLYQKSTGKFTSKD